MKTDSTITNDIDRALRALTMTAASLKRQGNKVSREAQTLLTSLVVLDRTGAANETTLRMLLFGAKRETLRGVDALLTYGGPWLGATTDDAVQEAIADEFGTDGEGLL